MVLFSPAHPPAGLVFLLFPFVPKVPLSCSFYFPLVPSSASLGSSQGFHASAEISSQARESDGVLRKRLNVENCLGEALKLGRMWVEKAKADKA
jgi:hypothetical protein